MGWCDRVEREKARRGIKGPENVPEPRWQQEGGLQGEEEGRREGWRRTRVGLRILTGR